MTLLHVTDAAGWAAVQRGPVAPDGFWHLCTPEQLPFVLDRHFPDRQASCWCCTSTRRGWARCAGRQASRAWTRFPHLYAPLAADAVVEVSQPPDAPS